MQPPRGRPSARHTFPRPIRLERHEVDLGSGDTSCIFQSPNDEQKASDLRSGVLTDRPATLSERFSPCACWCPKHGLGKTMGIPKTTFKRIRHDLETKHYVDKGTERGSGSAPRSTRPVTIPPPECPAQARNGTAWSQVMRVRSRSSNSPTLRDNRAARTLKPASPSWVVRNMACRSLPTSIGFHIYTTLISRRARNSGCDRPRARNWAS